MPKGDRSDVDASAGVAQGQMLSVICSQAAEVVDSDRSAVYLWGAGGELELAWLHGGGDHEAAAAAAPAIGELGKGSASLAVDPACLDGPWGREQGARDVLLVPLHADAVPIGVLALARTGSAARPYEARGRRVAEAVGQQASQFLDAVRRLDGHRSALRRLREEDERRSDHIAGVSHDLRAPLTAMLGYVRTLRSLDTALTPEERAEFLDIMERQIHRLSGMVDDMLIGARMDAGRLRPDERADVDLGALAAGVRDLLTPAHGARVELDRRAGPSACGDPRQLERVVQNLVDNALGHNPASTRVTVRTGGAGREAVLAVHDDGPPIPAEALPGLFERFGGDEVRSAGSIGLGLYTAKGIVEAHGGRIAVRSDAATGTTFEVRLPAAPGAAAG